MRRTLGMCRRSVKSFQINLAIVLDFDVARVHLK